MQREKSAGAVIFHRPSREFLILHYPGGHWDFVKGNVEKGEQEEDAAVREAKEETGLGIKIIPGFKEHIRYIYRHGDLVSKEVVFFIAEAKEKDVDLSEEHQGFKWLPFDEALKQITYKNSQDVLKKAREFLLKTVQ